MFGSALKCVTQWWQRSIDDRRSTSKDLGQAALVAVIAISVLASSIAALVVSEVNQSDPLQQAKSVEIYANRALEAGVNAYWTALNTNPSLAQCNSNTNQVGTCSGIDYGQWNSVPDSTSAGWIPEYYAFGNPQPAFDPVTNALSSLTVEVAGAAKDPTVTNHYLFATESITLTPSNGFLKNVWWSNYESYSSTGNYATATTTGNSVTTSRAPAPDAGPSTSVRPTTCSGRSTPTTLSSSPAPARLPPRRLSASPARRRP